MAEPCGCPGEAGVKLKPSRKQIQHGDKAAAVSVLRLGQGRKNFRDFPYCAQGVQVLFDFGGGGPGTSECVRHFRNVILNALFDILEDNRGLLKRLALR